jgi:hypothetical protein
VSVLIEGVHGLAGLVHALVLAPLAIPVFYIAYRVAKKH